MNEYIFYYTFLQFAYLCCLALVDLDLRPWSTCGGYQVFITASPPEDFTPIAMCLFMLCWEAEKVSCSVYEAQVIVFITSKM